MKEINKVICESIAGRRGSGNANLRYNDRSCLHRDDL